MDLTPAYIVPLRSPPLTTKPIDKLEVSCPSPVLSWVCHGYPFSQEEPALGLPSAGKGIAFFYI